MQHEYIQPEIQTTDRQGGNTKRNQKKQLQLCSNTTNGEQLLRLFWWYVRRVRLRRCFEGAAVGAVNAIPVVLEDGESKHFIKIKN